MSGITDALAVYRANQREVAASRLIVQAVGAALSPFRATEVLLYLDSDLWRDHLFVAIKNLPDLRLKLAVDSGLAVRNPIDFYESLAKQAYDALISIPRIEPPENCLLGEN